MKSFLSSFSLLDLRIKRIKSSSRFFSDRANDESDTNKQAKRCVNILRSKKAPTKVWAKRLRVNRTSGETTVIQCDISNMKECV